jgi:ethanolamine transporter EutH
MFITRFPLRKHPESSAISDAALCRTFSLVSLIVNRFQKNSTRSGKKINMKRLPAAGMVRTGVNNLFRHEDI